MSVFREQEPISPQDPLYYAPRRRAERSGVRPSAVTSAVGETKFDRPFSIDASTSPFARPAPLDTELEDAIGESLRRHLSPQVVPEPAEFVPERPRRRKSLVFGGIVAAVGIAAIVAGILVTVMSQSRDRGLGLGSASAADSAKPALSQFRSVLAPSENDSAATGEQSERLLDRFEQWRQKSDAAQPQQ